MLTPEVVEELWKFCVESTVYFATKKGGIYTAGYARLGFTSPLILKVAEEIKGAYPEIFDEEDHLTDFWVSVASSAGPLLCWPRSFAAQVPVAENARVSLFCRPLQVYNYDNHDLVQGSTDEQCPIMKEAEEKVAELTAQVEAAKKAAEAAPTDEQEALAQELIDLELKLQMYKVKKNSGIDIHADPSKITINMWLTPDESNLDPETGGLVVYKKNGTDGPSILFATVSKQV